MRTCAAIMAAVCSGAVLVGGLGVAQTYDFRSIGYERGHAWYGGQRHLRSTQAAIKHVFPGTTNPFWHCFSQPVHYLTI